MELQFNKTDFPCLRQAAWETQTQEQTQEIRLPEAMPDIGRVLGAWGQVLIRGKQWLTGGMSVSGGVMAWVLYAPEDGSEPRCMEGWIPFQMTWDFPDTERDGAMRVTCLLKSMDARSVSARKLMVRACVSVLGEAWEPSRVELYTPGELPEDVQVLRGSYPVKVPREAGEKTFLLDEELTVPASAPAMEKLLRYELRPELIDQKVMSEKVVFRGSANLHILYLAEDGRLSSWDFEIPFSQYTELEREYDQDAAARVALALTSLELEKDEDDRLRLKAGLVGQYIVYERPLIEVVEDAYSPSRQVTPNVQPLQMPVILDERQETLRAEQTIPAEGSQVADVAFFTEHPKPRRTENGVIMEISGTFQLLYWDGSGDVQSGTARWEGECELPTGADSRVEAAAFLTGQPQAGIAGGSAELRGEVLVEALTTTAQGIPMVTALELGERIEPDPDRPSLILRRAGESRLWDVAKDCGSTVEAIRQANHLQEEPSPEQILLIPVS